MNRLTKCCKTYVKTQKGLMLRYSQSILPHELAEEEEKELNDWVTIKKEHISWGTVSSSDINFDSVEYKNVDDKQIFYPMYGWFPP